MTRNIRLGRGWVKITTVVLFVVMLVVSVWVLSEAGMAWIVNPRSAEAEAQYLAERGVVVYREPWTTYYANTASLYNMVVVDVAMWDLEHAALKRGRAYVADGCLWVPYENLYSNDLIIYKWSAYQPPS